MKNSPISEYITQVTAYDKADATQDSKPYLPWLGNKRFLSRLSEAFLLLWNIRNIYLLKQSLIYTSLQEFLKICI